MRNEKIAKLFKEARIKKNKTIEQVAEDANISIKFLTYIENGELDKFDAPIYARGFLKKYAQYLNIDYEYISQIYEESNNKDINNNSNRTAFTFDYFFKLSINLIIICLIIISGFSLGFLRKKILSYKHIPKTHNFSGESLPVKSSHNIIKKHGDIKQSKLQIKATASDRVWIYLVIDGLVGKEIIMLKDDETIFKAKKSLRIWAGNAQHLRLYFNNTLLPINLSQKVIDKTIFLEKNNIKIIDTDKSIRYKKQ